MIKKLRIKFVCVIMLIAALMLAVILGCVIHFTKENLEMNSISTMQAHVSEPPHREDPGRQPKKMRLPHFTIELGKNGEIIGMDSNYFDLSKRDDIQQIVEAALKSDQEIGVLWKYGFRFLKDRAPKGQKIVFADITTEVATIRNLFWNCALIFLVAMEAFLGISILLSRWVIKPVEKAWEQQRQFVADASHELKTPLSVIMANAELMQNEDASAEDLDTYSGNILSMTYQMRGLVENMLDMARADNGKQTMQMTEVDFSQLVSDAVLSFRLLYEEKVLGLQSDVREGIFLRGSEQHLFQVMDVLLDNALKYSSLPGTVSVTLSAGGRHCLLSVFSPGEPIPREELKRIFERFYRADKARTMNCSYGLGLSIAEAVVEAHKGKIWAESSASGNTFFVRFPVSRIK